MRRLRAGTHTTKRGLVLVRSRSQNPAGFLSTAMHLLSVKVKRCRPSASVVLESTKSVSGAV